VVSKTTGLRHLHSRTEHRLSGEHKKYLEADMKKLNKTYGVVLLSTILSACGGGGGGDSSTTDQNDPVAATLKNLNVDITETPRVDAANKEIPTSFAPLGSSKTLAKKSELFLAGLGLSSSSSHVNVVKFKPGVSNVPGVPNTADKIEVMPASPLDSTWKNDLYNASAAGDIDGDGLEEIVELWWDSNDNAIRLKTIDDATENFTESPTSVLSTDNPSWLRVITGDFNGDGSDDIAIAIVDNSAGTVTIEFLSGSKTSGYNIDSAKRKTFTGTQTAGTSTLGIELSTGQLDLDIGEELGVVINETWGSGTNGSPGTGRSDYVIYDDESNNFATLKSGRVTGDVGATTYNGVTSTITMGDVDGDGMDEIVFAGLTDFSVTCESLPVIQYVLDDAANTFSNMGTDFNNDQGPSSCESSGNNGWTSHIWANTLDIDGDQYAEIQVNGVLYEDFFHAATPWNRMMVDDGGSSPVAAKIPFSYIFKNGGGNNQRARITRSDVVMAVGDVTSDGKEDIIVYTPGIVATGSAKSGSGTYLTSSRAFTIWGFDPLKGLWGKTNVLGNGYPSNGLLYAENLSGSPAAGGPPMIVTANVDNDSTMLKFSEGSHRVIFSEPILHAALSAPPCYGDGTQVSDDCRTSWGTGNTTGLNASISHEISVKHHTGVNGTVNLPFVGELGVEVEKTVGVSLKAEASLGYQLTKTVTYTTGPMEDTVIATVIPYDQYTYKILSHPVYPDLVGKDMVISLPRSPRTMQIDREFYNNSLVGIGTRVDSNIFSHTVGVPSSYPTRSQMLAKSGALSIGPKDIGASLGNQSLAINESVVAGVSATLSVSQEITVKATGGKVMEGFSVGSTTEASLGFIVGSDVTYQGTVGDMPPATFSPGKAYSFGMFAYKQNLGSEQAPIDVINYWVE
jgi:hypothetical protein